MLIDPLSSTTTSVSVTNLSASTQYSFEVVAYNTAGSGTTGWVTATTQAAAATRRGADECVKSRATSTTTATLSWTASTGATGYQIYEKNGNSSVELGSVAAGTTSVNITGLTPGGTDSFYVTAYNATSSASSATVSVMMPKRPASPPTNVTATATSSTAGTLSWTASAGATQYAIYYWNGRQAVYLGSVSGSATSVTISGMSPGTTYQFAIVAENSTSSAASGWVTLTTPVSSATRSSRG